MCVNYYANDFIDNMHIIYTSESPQGQPPYRLTMLADGNLVIYDSTNKPTWSSNIHNNIISKY